VNSNDKAGAREILTDAISGAPPLRIIPELSASLLGG
jgi:hypothetical protein